MQEPSKFCSACGAQNNLSAQFCQRCGARYTGAPPAPEPQRQRWLKDLKFPLRLAAAFFLCLMLGWIYNAFQRDKPTPSTSVGFTSSPAPVPADTGLADSLADNLAIVFAEAASRDAVGIAAANGTEIHVHIKDMKDFEFRRLQGASLAGIRLWMKKHSAELNQTQVQKICVNNGPLMGLSLCEAL
jgi:zinc-ribbon domain